jgi:hypothetical protein
MNMRKIIKYIGQMTLGSVLGVALWACSDMNELSDRFMNKGETVYAAKVDSVVVHAGYKKVGLNIYVGTRRIDTVKVYWNDYRNVRDVAVSNRQGVFPTVIEGLDESAYIFHLVSLDSYGNKSLPVEVSGEAFGDNRLSLLRSRSITSAELSPATGVTTIKWGAAVENSTGCQLTYTGTDDRPKTLDVAPDETTTDIPNFKSGLRFSTQFVLGEGSLAETFSADEASQTVLKAWNTAADKTGWLAEASSFHDNPRQASAAIDGNPMQPWHSKASGQSMPQWLLIDFGFGNALQIDGIIYQGRIDDINDRAFPKRLQWEASNDKSIWTSILSSDALEYPTTRAENPLRLPCTTPTTARYLRCTITETWPISRAYTYIGEMGIYQEVE